MNHDHGCGYGLRTEEQRLTTWVIARLIFDPEICIYFCPSSDPPSPLIFDENRNDAMTETLCQQLHCQRERYKGKGNTTS